MDRCEETESPTSGLVRAACGSATRDEILLFAAGTGPSSMLPFSLPTPAETPFFPPRTGAQLHVACGSWSSLVEACRGAKGGDDREAGIERHVGLSRNPSRPSPPSRVGGASIDWIQRGPGALRPHATAPSCRAMRLAPVLARLRARTGSFWAKHGPFFARILARISHRIV